MDQNFQAVVCTHCNVRMTEHRSAASEVRYFRCGTCHRWLSSTYAEILESDANFRARDSHAEAEKSRQFQEVKHRLERWLENLEGKDPYRLLGVSPRASFEEVRSAYREAALLNHPDRGGSEEKMAELNLAFERITQHQERNGLRPALPANGTMIPEWRPKAAAAAAPPQERVYRAKPWLASLKSAS